MEDLTKLEVTALAELYNTERECAAAYAGQKDWENSVRCTKAALGIWKELERRQRILDAQANELADVHRKRELFVAQARVLQAELDSLRAAHPIRWASITHSFGGGDGKRAPRHGDKHECGPYAPRIKSWFDMGIWFYGDDDAAFVVSSCPQCGGLLPTAERHEGNTPSRVESEPDDHQAQLSAINSAIYAAFKAVAHLIGGDHDTDHPADKVGQLRDLALRLEKSLAAAMGENVKLSAERDFEHGRFLEWMKSANENWLRADSADKRVAAVKRSRDAYARTAQELGEKLDAAHREIERLKAEINVDEKLLKRHGELLDSIPECPVHGSCIPFAIEWVENQKARINEAESQKHKKDSFLVFTDPAMPSTDKQVWATYKMEGGVWKVVDEVVAEPCVTCFFHQHGQCHHPSTSSYDPDDCRTRPADACGPAGKLWAEKAKESPKCEDCVWSQKMSYGLVCERCETRGFCHEERKYSLGICGPSGKLFEPRHVPVAMPAPPDAPRNEYAGEAEEVKLECFPKCQDCVHYIIQTIDNPGEGMCCHEMETDWHYERERQNVEGLCGPSGKLFEHREK